MGSRRISGHPDLALYRLLKGGETGLNLRLNDLFDRSIIVPSVWDLIKSFFRRRPITIIIKAYPSSLIERIIAVQAGVDKQIEREIEKAKSKGVQI